MPQVPLKMILVHVLGIALPLRLQSHPCKATIVIKCLSCSHNHSYLTDNSMCTPSMMRPLLGSTGGYFGESIYSKSQGRLQQNVRSGILFLDLHLLLGPKPGALWSRPVASRRFFLQSYTSSEWQGLAWKPQDFWPKALRYSGRRCSLYRGCIMVLLESLWIEPPSPFRASSRGELNCHHDHHLHSRGPILSRGCRRDPFLWALV